MPRATAIAEIRRQAGAQFDPRVASAFIDLLTGMEVADGSR